MADNICIFCGEKIGAFRATGITCGGVWETACKSCEKELRNLDELEICRRALVRGLAERPEAIRERIQVITEAENYRPACLRCGTKMVFGAEEMLDNSPLRDGILSDTFDVLPALCCTCGRYEFYNPRIVKSNKWFAYLIHKDTKE